MKEIYGISKGYRKVFLSLSPSGAPHPRQTDTNPHDVYDVKINSYRVQQRLSGGKPTVTLFTALDEDFHAAIKRPVSGTYSMSTLTEFEPFVDNTIRKFLERLDEEFVVPGRVCDVAAWLQYCEFCALSAVCWLYFL